MSGNDKQPTEGPAAEIKKELARLNEGLQGSDPEARQSVSITNVQAHELLEVTRTNAYNTALIEKSLLEIAKAVGGDALGKRISEQLGKQFAEELDNEDE